MAQHKLQQLVSQNVADVSHKGALLNDICSSPASHIRLCGPDRRWTTCGRTESTWRHMLPRRLQCNTKERNMRVL